MKYILLSILIPICCFSVLGQSSKETSIRRELVFYDLILEENAPLLRHKNELVQYMYQGVADGKLKAWEVNDSTERLLTLSDWRSTVEIPLVNFYEDCYFCAEEEGEVVEEPEEEVEEKDIFDNLHWANELTQIVIGRNVSVTKQLDTVQSINYIHVYIPAYDVEARRYAFSVKGDEFKHYLDNNFPDDLFYNSPTNIFWKGEAVLSAEYSMFTHRVDLYLTEQLKDSVIVDSVKSLWAKQGSDVKHAKEDIFKWKDLYYEVAFVEKNKKIKEVDFDLICYNLISDNCTGDVSTATISFDKIKKATSEVDYQIYSPYEYLLFGSLKPDSVVQLSLENQLNTIEEIKTKKLKDFEITCTEAYYNYRPENVALMKDSGFVQTLYLAAINEHLQVYKINDMGLDSMSSKELKQQCAITVGAFAEDLIDEDSVSYQIDTSVQQYLSAYGMNIFHAVGTKKYNAKGKPIAKMNIDYITFWLPADHPDNMKGIEIFLFSLKWKDVKAFFAQNKTVYKEGHSWIKGFEDRAYQPTLLKTGHPKRLN